MNIAILLFGGKGERFDPSIPKQYFELNNKPLFYYPISTFQNHPLIDKIYLVCDSSHIEYMRKKCSDYNFSKVCEIIKGGSTRAISCKNALSFIKAKEDDVILIHDGDRVFVSEQIINENILLMSLNDAVVTAIKCDDSLIKGDQFIDKYLKRDDKYCVQTPQTFRYKLILDGHLKNANKNVGDDGLLVLKLNKKVAIAPGEKINFKITTKKDLALAKAILER